MVKHKAHGFSDQRPYTDPLFLASSVANAVRAGTGGSPWRRRVLRLAGVGLGLVALASLIHAAQQGMLTLLADWTALFPLVLGGALLWRSGG